MARGLVTQTKFCYRCDSAKPLSEFAKDRSTKTGLSAYCRDCRGKMKTEQDNRKRRIDPEWREMMKEKDRNRYYKRTYGISLAEYDELLEHQKGVCAICGKENNTNYGRAHNGRLCVDHCHESGEIRGLLCGSCNAALGHFKDNKDLLKKAMKYLAGGK